MAQRQLGTAPTRVEDLATKGYADARGLASRFKGEWASTGTYVRSDVVRHKGALYVADADGLTHEPGTTAPAGAPAHLVTYGGASPDTYAGTSGALSQRIRFSRDVIPSEVRLQTGPGYGSTSSLTAQVFFSSEVAAPDTSTIYASTDVVTRTGHGAFTLPVTTKGTLPANTDLYLVIKGTSLYGQGASTPSEWSGPASVTPAAGDAWYYGATRGPSSYSLWFQVDEAGAPGATWTEVLKPPAATPPYDLPAAVKGAWASGTTYPTGAVALGTTGTYVSQAANNTGVDPDLAYASPAQAAINSTTLVGLADMQAIRQRFTLTTETLVDYVLWCIPTSLTGQTTQNMDVVRQSDQVVVASAVGSTLEDATYSKWRFALTAPVMLAAGVEYALVTRSQTAGTNIGYGYTDNPSYDRLTAPVLDTSTDGTTFVAASVKWVLFSLHRTSTPWKRLTSNAPTTASLGTANLNDITTQGTYYQDSDFEAATDRNYPVAEAGVLEVTVTPGWGAYQRYTTRTQRVFIRGQTVLAGDPGGYVMSFSPSWVEQSPVKPKRGLLQSSRGPASQTDFTSLAIVTQFGQQYEAGRKYRINAYCEGLQVTATGTATVRLAGSTGVGLPISMLYRVNNLGAGQWTSGSLVELFEPTESGHYVIQITAATTAGAHRITANAARLWVEDITYE